MRDCDCGELKADEFVPYFCMKCNSWTVPTFMPISSAYGTNDSEGYGMFTWNFGDRHPLGEHHVEFEHFSDGRGEWFYKNRITYEMFECDVSDFRAMLKFLRLVRMAG